MRTRQHIIQILEHPAIKKAPIARYIYPDLEGKHAEIKLNRALEKTPLSSFEHSALDKYLESLAKTLAKTSEKAGKKPGKAFRKVRKKV